MNLAPFDFDGTLTTRETMPEFMHHAVPPLRRALGVPVFAPMLAGYKLGLVSGTRIRHHVIAFGFRGVPAAHVHAAGERYAAEVLPLCCVPRRCSASPGASRKATRSCWFPAASTSISRHGAGNTAWN